MKTILTTGALSNIGEALKEIKSFSEAAMKNRSGYLFIVGLLLMTAQTIYAQQPSNNGARNNSAEMKCRTPVTVTGAVVAPIRVELRRRARLNELLTLAGGLTERANGKIEITRATLGSDFERLKPTAPDKKTESIEVDDLAELIRGNEEANPYLQPGDIIAVSEVGMVYVIGNVLRPQSIILKEPTTVTQAITAAGGALSDSFIERVRIMRGCDPTMKIILVDLKAVKKGRASDVAIQPYDIVFVPGKRAYFGTPPCYRITPSTSEIPLRVIY